MDLIIFKIFLIVLIATYALIFTLYYNPVTRIINSNWSLKNYFMLTLLIISAIIAYFIIIRFLFNLLKIHFIGDNLYLTNYFYMFLAIMSITMLLGYYYVSELSKNKLKDFLLILSLSFVNSFAVVSAMKNIPKIN